MSGNFQVIQLTISEEVLKKLDIRLRNQLIGCMHAHNELVILNRILMFSMNITGGGELHDSAQTVQMWCLLQVLAAKLVETWKMVETRFLKSVPEDAAVAALEPKYKDSLTWLQNYFSDKQNALLVIRDKTAFHYDKLNLEDAANNLAANENNIYLAQHPANSLYYLGSAMIFRTVFAMIANKGQSVPLDYGEQVSEGVRITSEAAQYVNWHMHLLLYALMKILLERGLGHGLENLDETRIDIKDAPDPELVSLPVFIDIGRRSS